MSGLSHIFITVYTEVRMKLLAGFSFPIFSDDTQSQRIQKARIELLSNWGYHVSKCPHQHANFSKNPHTDHITDTELPKNYNELEITYLTNKHPICVLAWYIIQNIPRQLTRFNSLHTQECRGEKRKEKPFNYQDILDYINQKARDKMIITKPDLKGTKFTSCIKK